MSQHPILHYQQVAEVYYEAGEAGRHMGKDVAATWGVPISTAHRWVKRCRELGLITERPVVCRGRCPHCCPR